AAGELARAVVLPEVSLAFGADAELACIQAREYKLTLVVRLFGEVHGHAALHTGDRQRTLHGTASHAIQTHRGFLEGEAGFGVQDLALQRPFGGRLGLKAVGQPTCREETHTGSRAPGHTRPVRSMTRPDAFWLVFGD